MDPTALFFALLSTIGFGLIAVFVTQTSRKIGPVPALFLFQVLGIPLFAFLIPLAPRAPDSPSLLPVIFAAVLFSFNYLLFLYSAKIGQLAVVGPIGQLYMVVTAMLGIVFLGESFGLGKLLSMILILIGIILFPNFIIISNQLPAGRGNSIGSKNRILFLFFFFFFA